MYSSTYPPIHQSIHSFIHLLSPSICTQLTYSHVLSFIRPFLFVHSPTHQSIHSSIHLPTPSIHPLFILLSIHLFTHLFIHPSIHPFIHLSTYSCTHPFPCSYPLNYSIIYSLISSLSIHTQSILTHSFHLFDCPFIYPSNDSSIQALFIHPLSHSFMKLSVHYLCVCIHFLVICPCIHSSTHLFIYPGIHLSIYVSFHPSTLLFNYLFFIRSLFTHTFNSYTTSHPPIYLSIYPSIH